MLNFFYVDTEYVDYLRAFDSRIPYLQYEDKDKFVCGIVMSVDGCDYFAPISSKTHKQQTCIMIRDKDGTDLSSIKFNYMFPAPEAVVTRVDIGDIRKSDPSYANLLQKEYEFCKANESSILAKAQKVYAIGCKPGHFLNSSCCDFKLLEEKSKAYFITITDEAFADYEEKHANDNCDE